MKPIQLGLAGLGGWPRQAYLPILQELDTAQVCAVAARSESSRRFAVEQFGEAVTLYDDYHALVGDSQVEAVLLALPNRHHVDGIQAAVAAGKHVFYEPPIGHTADELQETLRIMGASERTVQADLELRYLPVVAAVRRHLLDETVGKPLMARIRLWCDWGRGDGPRDQEEPTQRGFFPWLGCWYLDVLDCVFGTAPERAYVTGGHAANGRLMDHGWADFGYPGGGIGQFEFSLVAVEDLDIRLTVLCRHGEMEADLKGGSLRWRRHDTPWNKEDHPPSLPAYGFEGMRECIADFLDCIRTGRTPDAGVQVAERVHAAMLCCMEAEAGTPTVA